jgi:transcriptional regulator with XRE-family HTH domain
MSNTSGDPTRTLTQLVVIEIRIQMARVGIRQGQLARRIGKNDEWLSGRMRGRVPLNLEDIALIADGLGIDVASLVPPDFPSLAVPLPGAGHRPRPTSPRPHPRPRPSKTTVS